MICPKCETEYVEGVSKCTDCHIDLVESFPEEEIFVCDNCNNDIDENDTWCSHCGVFFETAQELCIEHKAAAIGKCLICQNAVCGKDSTTVKNKLFCKDHDHYIFSENGWARVYETGHDWEAELVKQELENNNIPAVVDNHKDHTRQFTIGYLSSIYVLVPFEDVIDAEDVIKRRNQSAQ
jgi:hypothetical protein